MVKANEPDVEEKEANDLEAAQDLRWLDSDRSINFWRIPEEVETRHKIMSLRKMSASYQRRHGYPPTGLAFTHQGPINGPYQISASDLAHMIAAHTSGITGSFPEQIDFDRANAILVWLEAELSK